MSETFMIRVRDKGEITLPIELRKLANLITGDWLNIEILESGQICLHKIIPHRAPNKNHQT